MASFSALGVGSGMDLASLLTNLVAAERKPKEALLTQQLTSYNSKISGLGTLSSKLASLQTAAQGLKPATLQSAMEKFASYTGNLDEKIGKVTVGEGAVAGNYELKVTQLAQAQKSVSNAAPATLMSGTFTIQFTDAGTTRSDISINVAAGSNLEDLRNAINAKQNESGVSASIIKDGAGQRLVLSGADGEKFTVGGTTGGGLGFIDKANAQEARFSIDGIDLTSASNKITDVINGVTIDLVGVSPGGVGTTLSVTKESETKLKSSLEAFVKAYNDANSSIRSLGAYDAETKKAGALQGNSVLRETQGLLSRLVFDQGNPGDATYGQTLSSIGVSFSKSGDGSLTIDAEKLAAAIAKNPDAVSSLAARVGAKFDDYNTGLGGIVGTGGRIQTSTESLKTSVRDVEKRQEALELHMQKVEARYRAQFSALDVMISSLNSLSSSLAASLSGLSTSYTK